MVLYSSRLLQKVTDSTTHEPEDNRRRDARIVSSDTKDYPSSRPVARHCTAMAGFT
jgi:hypothetical protein